MTNELFKLIVSRLVEKHYLLTLEDTPYYDDNLVSQLVENGVRPFEVVNDHAEECDLERAELEGFYGVRSKALLTAADEDAITTSIPGGAESGLLSM